MALSMEKVKRVWGNSSSCGHFLPSLIFRFSLPCKSMVIHLCSLTSPRFLPSEEMIGFSMKPDSELSGPIYYLTKISLYE